MVKKLKTRCFYRIYLNASRLLFHLALPKYLNTPARAPISPMFYQISEFLPYPFYAGIFRKALVFLEKLHSSGIRVIRME
jgi:hypothetical protein